MPRSSTAPVLGHRAGAGPSPLPRRGERPGGWGLPIALLTALAALYFALSAADGIVSTNDGSHYALTKALAVDGAVRIDPYVNYAAVQPRQGTPTPDDYRDVSRHNGHYYSDRPPGTAFLAMPLYWLGDAVGAISARKDLDFPLRYATMLPPLLGAAATLALCLLARALGAGTLAAVATAATGALGTLLLKYATLLYSHIAAAACVTGALAAILWADCRPERRGVLLTLGGALLGYAAVVEYPNLLLVVPVGLYVLRQARDQVRGRWWFGAPVRFGLAWLVPVAVLLGYDWIAFGRPWRTSYTYQYYFDWSRSLVTTYVTPPWVGLRGLLLGDSRMAGLLVVTPAFLLALWGLAILARRAPARAALLAGIVLTILLPTAFHRTYWGGGSRDTRYLLAITPALYAPLAVWLEAVVRPRRPIARLALLVATAGLCGWGLLRSYLSLLAMFGHRAAEYEPGDAFTLLRRNWPDLAVIAPGRPLLPYFLALVLPCAGLLWIAAITARMMRARGR